MNIFYNMLERIHLWHDKLEYVDKKIEVYLQYNHFSRLNLGGVNLGGENLRGADLGEANLRRANLREAILNEVNLFEAYLGGAYLCGADLREVNLRGAYLIDVNLSGANLVGVELIDVKLENPKLEKTIFDEEQVNSLCGRYDLSKSMVFSFETDEAVKYVEYSIRKYKDNEMERK